MLIETDLVPRSTLPQVIADGVLVDVTPTAREAGFRWAVALTAAAWARCVATPPGVACQDFALRVRNDNLARRRERARRHRHAPRGGLTP